MAKASKVAIGFDVGGAHLKVARVEDGRVVAAAIIAMPLWQGLDRLDAALREAEPVYRGGALFGFTMTGELVDLFPSRADGVSILLDRIAAHFPAEEHLIYAGRSGFVGMDAAAGLAADIASANWHATASLVGRLAGEALFVDMGSTTTDIIPVRGGKVVGKGYSDAERMATGELVYTGFTRTFLFGVASSAPVRGQFAPVMNEYFASIADAHRVLGVLDEDNDKHATADGREKTVAGSTARLARMLGRDAAELSGREWRDVARWFSEQQLRLIHDAAFRVSGVLAEDAPLVAAGTGRWQIRRLANRLERPFVDLAEVMPVVDAARDIASSAAPAAAVALLAGGSL
ncbi:hydantoinase/oxoprolinase family protein [Mesorhizobium sp. LHD-90]|uniref:hydantoinase/oxoprolinase family protein n=1 Tax=Mesorhizobium sp. LHD-90 TaxID=3071414 RepID=UPI0027E00067|nr:hydantoinase/oxoprolinase family protein [Mesorhizobium sp. LHD-90]MDQ6438248.1 hydantoinase/oxoprolinase family protein [Mesorhizobium sp. LHD-90]